VDKHNPQVMSIRGMQIDQIDLQATVEKLLLRLSTSVSSLVVHDGVYELVFLSPGDSPEGATKEIIRLDAATMLPISAESFEGTQLVQHAEWSDYIVNAGLPDRLFDVNWDPHQLETGGIPSVLSVPLR
jgi:outer membrane lipoprotein-sorting protein